MGKVTVLDVQKAKEEGRKLTMITAYDYPTGLIAEQAGMDIVLVGDSLGMVVLGLQGTVEVTMEDMIHHIKATVRGCKSPMIVGDMPFGSYNVSIPEAVHNANRLMKEGGCDVIKLEGGVNFAPTVEAIVKAGIPVQGHIGLTPQTASALGGFKMQGKDASAAKAIVDDARALEQAGAFSIVVEAVPRASGQTYRRNGQNSNRRHRRRPGCGRSGPGASRPHRPVRPLRAQVRQTVFPDPQADPGSRGAVQAGSPERRVPRPRTFVQDAGRNPGTSQENAVARVDRMLFGRPAPPGSR